MNVGPVRPQDATEEPVLIQRPAPEPARGKGDAGDPARQVQREAERLAARLRAPDRERQLLVDAARRKLASGELDVLDALRQTARRLLEDRPAG